MNLTHVATGAKKLSFFDVLRTQMQLYLKVSYIENFWVGD